MTKQKNVNQTIEIVTLGSAHWYPSQCKKNLWYPSVTSIIAVYPKGAGFNKYLTEQSSWESAQEKLEEAGTRGTRIHDGTEALERGETLQQEVYHVEEWQRLIGFVNWYKTYKPERLLSEHKLVSDKYKTGGTIDRVYKIDDQIVLLDIKTGKRTYKNYWIQVAAYEKLLAEKKVIEPVNLLAILRLTPLRKEYYDYSIKDEWAEEWEVFKSCQKTWWYENGKDAQPKILELPTELKLKHD